MAELRHPCGSFPQRSVKRHGDKRMTLDDVVAELRDGMTIGIGGWALDASRWRWSARSCDPISRI